MKDRIRQGIPGAVVIALLLSAPMGSRAQGAPVLDQEQLAYNGGTSARTLAGYTIWQSFTAGLAGTLVEIDMGFFNDMSGFATLEIREGAGSSGAVLQSLDVPVVGISRPGVTWNAWTVSVPVLAGSQYTFEITPDATTLPDPYGVAIGAGNPYLGGAMGIDDPSGTYPTDFDCVFRTFVSSGAPADIDVYRNTSPQDLDTLPNEIGSVTASPFDDLAPPSTRILFYAVSEDLSAPAVIFVRKLAGNAVQLWWP